MSNYNPSDNVNESFGFVLKYEGEDKKYIFRYPIVEELEKVQSLNTDLNNTEDDKEKERLSEEVQGFLYSFITPVGHDIAVKDALKKQNIKVMRNFNRMIQSEFSME